MSQRALGADSPAGHASPTGWCLKGLCLLAGGWAGGREPWPRRSVSSPEMGVRGGPLPGPHTGPGPWGRPSWPRSRPAQELPLLGKGPVSSCSRNRSRWRWLFTTLGPEDPQAQKCCWGSRMLGRRGGVGCLPGDSCGGACVKSQLSLFCCVTLEKSYSLYSVNDFSPWAWPTCQMRGLSFLTFRMRIGTSPACLAGSHEDGCRQPHSTLAKCQVVGQ